jgi:hypothetical protein
MTQVLAIFNSFDINVDLLPRKIGCWERISSWFYFLFIFGLSREPNEGTSHEQYKYVLVISFLCLIIWCTLLVFVLCFSVFEKRGYIFARYNDCSETKAWATKDVICFSVDLSEAMDVLHVASHISYIPSQW